MKKKKGEITSGMLITIVLLIVGFAILLFFLFRIEWGQSTDRSVCHESVILRATLPDIAKGFSSLRCRTVKYCVTDKNVFQGSGDCTEEYGHTKGITTVRMGEGKISLFSEGKGNFFGFGDVYPSCIVCSRVAFDKDFDDGLLEQMNLPIYLATHYVPGTEKTYAQYLSGNIEMIGVGNEISGFSIDEAISNLTGGGKINSDSSSVIGSIDNENAILFMQISAPRNLDELAKLFKGTGFALGGSFVLAPKTVSSLTGKALGSPVTWFLIVGALITQQARISKGRAVAAGYCGSALVGPGARDGCSIVKTVDYNVEGIADYCKNIESIG
jgi:hypothetical protein